MKILVSAQALVCFAFAMLVVGCGSEQPGMTQAPTSQSQIRHAPTAMGTPLPQPPTRRKRPGSIKRGVSGGYLYLADEYNSQIDVFPLAGNKQAQIGMITDGVSTPYALWNDAHKYLYVANQGNNTVTRYGYGGTTPLKTWSQDLSRPLYPIVDSYGNLFVGNANNGTIVEYKSGSTSAYQVIQTPGVEVDGLAFDQQGNLYAAYRTAPEGSGSIEEFAPGSTQGQILGMDLDQPQGLIVDTSGNIVVAITGGPNSLLVFPPGSQTPSTTLPLPDKNTPTQVMIDKIQAFLYDSSFTNDTGYGIRYPFTAHFEFVKDQATALIQGVMTTNNLLP